MSITLGKRTWTQLDQDIYHDPTSHIKRICKAPPLTNDINYIQLPKNITILKSYFPHMDPNVIEKVYEESQQNLILAIESLNKLKINDSPQHSYCDNDSEEKESLSENSNVHKMNDFSNTTNHSKRKSRFSRKNLCSLVIDKLKTATTQEIAYDIVKVGFQRYKYELEERHTQEKNESDNAIKACQKSLSEHHKASKVLRNALLQMFKEKEQNDNEKKQLKMQVQALQQKVHQLSTENYSIKARLWNDDMSKNSSLNPNHDVY